MKASETGNGNLALHTRSNWRVTVAYPTYIGSVKFSSITREDGYMRSKKSLKERSNSVYEGEMEKDGSI